MSAEARGSEGAPEVSIVVPVTDTRAEVAEVVRALGAELDALGRSWECFLVYDGLRGEAWEVGLELQASTREQVKTIVLHRPFGESVCLQSAMQHAQGELILTAPQYVQTDPEDLGALFSRVDEGADFVTTWRFPRIDAWPSRAQSAAFNLVMRRIVGADFHDLNSTLRLFRREVLEDLTLYGENYRYLPSLAWRQGFRVEEVRVKHVAERGSRGFYGPGVFVRRALDIIGVTFLTRFTHKPLRFFGAVGGALIALGFVLSSVVVTQWLIDSGVGLFQRTLFQTGVLVGLLGAQLIGFGLVGEIIVFTQARNLREYRIERTFEPAVAALDRRRASCPADEDEEQR